MKAVTWQLFATILAEQPGMFRKLLVLHVASGGRCRACTTAGTGTPGERWPCSVYEIAALAEEIHLQRMRAHHLGRRPG